MMDLRDFLKGYDPSHRVVRTTQKEDIPRRHDGARPYDRGADRAELAAELEEWLADWEGTHSIFED